MAFFKNFQQSLNLPSMSSLVDTLSNAVDDLTSAVGDVSYTVADSVTEQVTSMINSLRTEDATTTQLDKSVVGKEGSVTPLSHDNEKPIKGKEHNVQEQHTQVHSLKQNKNVGKEGPHNKDKQQNQINAIESNEILHDGNKFEAVNNTVKHRKHKMCAGSENVEKVTLQKDSTQASNKCRMVKSFSQHLNKESHTVIGQSQDLLHKKERSPRVDMNNTKEVHAVPPIHLERIEQTEKSQKNHVAPDVKGKKCKTLSDDHSQSLIKQEESEPSTLSKQRKKNKQSGLFSKEVSSKKTPEKDNSYMNKDQRGSSSESEDETLGKYHEALSRTQNSRPSAGNVKKQKNYVWETRQKYSPLSAEYDGYSSEASIDEGKRKEERAWWHLVHEGGKPAQHRTLVAEKTETSKP